MVGIKYNTSLWLLVAVVMICGSNRIASGYSIDMELVFSRTVGTSENIVAGTVVRTEYIDVTTQFRTSVFYVDDVVVGGYAPGDSLFLNWRANRWFPEGAMAWTDSESAQLNEYHGLRALMILRGYSGDAAPTGEYVSFDPFVISCDNIVELRKLIGLLDNPEETLTALFGPDWKSFAGDTSSGSPAKRASVSTFLSESTAQLECSGD